VDEIQIPEGAAFRIQLGTFEGPLDLLLHLIKKHELNILDLPIAFVTERYLDYLSMMQELDLDVASEYLLMAATLAHIKSKMLLPQNPLDEVEESDDGYIADPRAELIRRLLEYQKYRAAAEQLGARPIAGRDVFARGSQTEEAQGAAPLAPIDLYKLLDAFGAILKRVKGRVALEVTAEQITIGERIAQLSELLRSKRSCVFDELFAKDRTRYEVVVTFLALLEMTKLRITRVYQADPTSPLHIQYALLDADEPALPPEEEVTAAFASTPEEAVEAHEALDESTIVGSLHANDPEVALEGFGADEPITTNLSDSSDELRTFEPESEPDPEPDALDLQTGGLEFDALQPDASPVDAMAGIFDEPAEVTLPEAESTPEETATSETESSEEDPAGDRETPA
jgi:segregation and condensation protein A